MEPLLLTIEEAAKLVGIGRDYAYTLVESGEWPTVQASSKRTRKVPRAFLYARYSAHFANVATCQQDSDTCEVTA